jgi:4-amino-4-deoxy-L-arabinose transferase-like glycosyltransferase
MSSRSPEIELAPIGVEQVLRYLTIGALSCLVVTILERLAPGLQGHMLRTEIYSIHGFSHIFFGIGLASIILFFRPRSTARVVILAVLLAGIVWELHEGYWLRGEPLDSVEDMVLAILSASTFLCLTRRIDRETNH